MDFKPKMEAGCFFTTLLSRIFKTHMKILCNQKWRLTPTISAFGKTGGRAWIIEWTPVWTKIKNSQTNTTKPKTNGLKRARKMLSHQSVCSGNVRTWAFILDTIKRPGPAESVCNPRAGKQREIGGAGGSGAPLASQPTQPCSVTLSQSTGRRSDEGSHLMSTWNGMGAIFF